MALQRKGVRYTEKLTPDWGFNTSSLTLSTPSLRQMIMFHVKQNAGTHCSNEAGSTTPARVPVSPARRG
jgi:hypothetical protein